MQLAMPLVVETSPLLQMFQHGLRGASLEDGREERLRTRTPKTADFKGASQQELIEHGLEKFAGAVLAGVGEQLFRRALFADLASIEETDAV